MNVGVVVKVGRDPVKTIGLDGIDIYAAVTIEQLEGKLKGSDNIRVVIVEGIWETQCDAFEELMDSGICDGKLIFFYNNNCESSDDSYGCGFDFNTYAAQYGETSKDGGAVFTDWEELVGVIQSTFNLKPAKLPFVGGAPVNEDSTEREQPVQDDATDDSEQPAQDGATDDSEQTEEPTPDSDDSAGEQRDIGVGEETGEGLEGVKENLGIENGDFEDEISETPTVVENSVGMQDDSAEEIQRLKELLANSERLVAELRVSVDVANKAAADVESGWLQRYTNLEHSLMARVEQAELDKTGAEARAAELEKAMADCDVESSSLMEQYKSEAEQYKSEVERLTIELDTAKADLERADGEVATLLSDIERESSSTEALSIQIEEYKDSAKAAEAESDMLRELNKGLEEELASRKSEIASLEARLSIASRHRPAQVLGRFTCDYSGRAKVIGVSGSDSVTTVAMSIAHGLVGKNVLYMDFDVTNPKAEAWFKRVPIISDLDGVSNPLMRSAFGSVIHLGERGAAFVLSNKHKLLHKALEGTPGSADIDYFSGVYSHVDDSQLAKCNFTELFNGLGGLYDYIVIDLGNNIDSRLAEMVARIASNNVIVARNDRFDVRNTSVKMHTAGVVNNYRVWVLNKVDKWHMSNGITDTVVLNVIKDSPCVLVPVDGGIMLDTTDFTKVPGLKSYAADIVKKLK